MKKTILFNKETGVFFGSFDSEGFDASAIDPNYFLYKEVELGEDNFWYGDYETGAVYDSKSIAIISQTQIRDETITKIFNEYPPIRQTQIVIDQLKALVSEENQTEEFVAMTSFIDEARAEYQAKKETFSSNPEAYIWVSDEEVAENSTKHYAGLI